MPGICSRMLLNAVVGLIVLSGMGCSTPEVYYQRVSEPDDLGLYKFSLRKSTILLEAKQHPTNGRSIVPWEPTATSVSVPDEQIFSIRTRNDSFQETNLDVTYIPNTRLVSSLGVDVEDKVRQFIETVGAITQSLFKIASTITPYSETPEKPDDAPYEFKMAAIDTSKYLKTDDSDPISGPIKASAPLELPNDARAGQAGEANKKKGKGNTKKGWYYDLHFSAISASAVELATFIPRTKKQGDGASEESTVEGDGVHVFVHSACRDLKLNLKYYGINGKVNDKYDFTWKLTVADPNYIETIALPEKGKISMHSTCGADVVTERTDNPKFLQVLSTLISTAESTAEAFKNQTGGSK